MDSPDVEDFPGLYEEACRSNDSDYSEEGKKELLLSKRKDKKKDKEKGYAALEGESSGGEDSKSPSKTKKPKSFKFTSSKKEKKDKKESKDHEKQDKKEKKDKDAKKCKPKDKDKKKSKHKDELIEDVSVFGVALHVAVERQPCKDGVQIPLVVRECIDYVEETGLAVENIYRTSVVKMKLQQLRQKYDKGETVNLYNYEPCVAANLLKLYLRELPEPILSGKCLSAWEEASSDEDILTLFNQLPTCSKTLLSWLFTHFQHVMQREKQNKMSVKEMVLMLAPTLQLNSKVLHSLITHHDTLFGGTRLTRHSLPAVDVATGIPLPQTPEDLFLELAKREAILEQLHAEMRQGVSSDKQDELLWETQRIVTLLKRRLRQFQQQNSSKSRSESTAEEEKLDLSVKTSSEQVAAKSTSEQNAAAESLQLNSESTTTAEMPKLHKQPDEPQVLVQQTVGSHETKANNKQENVEEGGSRRGSYVTIVSIDLEKAAQEDQEALREELALLILEEGEILFQQAKLRANIQKERAEVEALKVEIANRVKELGEEVIRSRGNNNIGPEEAEEITQSQNDNKKLEIFNSELLERIVGEQLACARLQAHIQLIKIKQQLHS